MKTPSTDLFHLIKSLSAQEKKYFKQYSQQYSEERENTYLLLFDAIAEQLEYDEEAIKTKFAGYDFTKQLSVAKNYLYDKILDALFSMHRETDENLNMARLIARFEMLIKKNLPVAALSAYDKTERAALEINKLTMLPHIARQKNLILSRIEKKFQTTDLITNAEVALEHAKVLANFLEYELLSIKANALFAMPAVNTDPKLIKELDDLMAHPLFQHEESALSMMAWFFYTRTKYRYIMMKGDFSQGFDLLRNSIQHIKRYPSDSRNWQASNYRLYTDLLFVSFQLKKYDECRQILDEIQVLIDLKHHPLHAMIHEHFRYTLTYAAESGGQIKEAIALWEEKQAWWETEKNKMEPNNFMNAMYAAMKIYFMMGNWQKAIFLCNEVNASKFVWDTHLMSHMYWLMIQYEIHNLELLKNQSHSTLEWFKKNKIATSLEKMVFSFFEKLPSARDKSEVNDKFIALKEKVAQYKTAESSDEIWPYNDLELWIDSKIRNVPFVELIKQPI